MRILPNVGRRKRQSPDGPQPADPTLVKCAECDRSVNEFKAIAERWTYWSDGVGELHPYCPACATRELDA